MACFNSINGRKSLALGEGKSWCNLSLSFSYFMGWGVGMNKSHSPTTVFFQPKNWDFFNNHFNVTSINFWKNSPNFQNRKIEKNTPFLKHLNIDYFFVLLYIILLTFLPPYI
jgi:hypothetical protein